MELPVDIDPLDKLPTVAKIAGISRPYIYLLISRNKFPRPVKLGRASAWLRSEVLAWVAARVSERDSSPSKPIKAGANP
jgi:prophage regulatory protein